MECKLKKKLVANPIKWELIDTLWNVNMILFGLKLIVTKELIDTLWNVNGASVLRQPALSLN